MKENPAEKRTKKPDENQRANIVKNKKSKKNLIKKKMKRPMGISRQAMVKITGKN